MELLAEQRAGLQICGLVVSALTQYIFGTTRREAGPAAIDLAGTIRHGEKPEATHRVPDL